MNQPDPQKAIYLQPNQQRVPGERRSPKPAKTQPQWEAHQSDQALDAWGVALREMRRTGQWGGSES
ncbi:MAG: hypothetical protein IPM39_09505 [Chloroflexi bacterium]|nr:hypothetical protein [Chloroflexota bacterium]